MKRDVTQAATHCYALFMTGGLHLTIFPCAGWKTVVYPSMQWATIKLKVKGWARLQYTLDFIFQDSIALYINFKHANVEAFLERE